MESHRRASVRAISPIPETNEPRRPHNSTSRYTVLDSDSEDEPLPEFWEKIRLDDGKVVFLDHKTQQTTWEDPRRARMPSPLPDQAPVAWRARLLVAGVEDPEDQPRVTQHRFSPISDISDISPLPDLAHEGYAVSIASRDDLLPDPDALPDFWEIRRGLDGKLYYVDHVNASIIERINS